MAAKVLVLDNGLYPSIAARLAEFTDVAYFSSWNSAYPISREFAPGIGIKGVERVNEPIRYMLDGKASHVVVADLYLNGYEALARKLEFPTFGCNSGNEMETDRTFMLDFLGQQGLPVAPTVEVTGLDDLRTYLKGVEDKYIKVSIFRGDMESWHHEDYASSEPKLTSLAVRFGPLANQIRFQVQDAIASVCEAGLDTYFLNGAFVQPSLLGWEIKDAGYAGYLIRDTPKEFKPVMAAMAKYFKESHYQCFFSNEMRITKDGTVYQTDCTCRMPSPPSGVMIHACKNIDKVLLAGKAPDYGKAEFFCEIILSSADVSHDFLAVSYPKELRGNYAFHNYCEVDGKTWILPNEQWSDASPPYVEFGSALGWGASLSDASEMAEEAAEACKASHLTYGSNVLEKARGEMEKLPF